MDNTLPKFFAEKGYTKGAKIHSGRFVNSQIYSATVKTKDFTKKICLKQYVLESVQKDWENMCLNSELKILKKIKHPYIIRVWDAIKTQHSVYIFMNYAPKGTLMDLLDREKRAIEENQVKFWCSQILSALCYCHSEGIAHRDIKLKCLLLDSDFNALLSDFKFGRIKDKSEEDLMRVTPCGTRAYNAPEVHPDFMSTPYNACIADMYSYGVCVFQLLNYHLPFDPMLCDTKPIKYFEKQCKRDYKYHSKIEANLSKDIKDLVHKLLDPNPGMRLSSDNAIRMKAFIITKEFIDSLEESLSYFKNKYK